MSFGVGSWVLSLGFYGWCIKILSILFICISSHITTHGFLFFNGHYLAQGIHQICTSALSKNVQGNETTKYDIFCTWSKFLLCRLQRLNVNGQARSNFLFFLIQFMVLECIKAHNST